MKVFSFIWIIFLFYTSHLEAQLIQGKILGKDNRLALEGVLICNSSKTDSVFSDINGFFQVNTPGAYTFSKKGYYSTDVIVQSNIFVLVLLEEKPFELSEVVIKSNHFQSELKKISASISIIPENRIKSNDGLNFTPILNGVPGVFMHSGTLNTNRITIRGIGSRNLFGTSKIRAYYEDIPLTNGSGETTLEDMELQGIARMEIIKGPSSSLYGAGLGGTIQLIPDKGMFNSFFIESSYTFGSYGLGKFWLSSNLGNEANSAKINFSSMSSDGYRDNNQTNRQNLTISSNHILNKNNALNVIGNFIDMKAYIPSSLDEEDYLNNPERAAFTWARSKGFEDYSKLLLGLSWEHNFSENSKLISSVFGGYFDSYEARPFNIQDQNIRSIGLRSRYIKNSSLINRKLLWTVGIEIFNDQSLLKTYENLYRDFPPETGSVQGDLLSDFDENRFYSNLFTEWKYHLSEKFILDLGLNLNQTSYDLDDNYNENELDRSGSYSFDLVVSPKAGLTFQADQFRMLFATVSHGFSPPKLEETLLPDGVINTDIKPETGWNYEIGSRGKLLKNRFNYEISLYLMDIDNLLVPRRIGDDQFVGVNAGKTLHKGVEITLNYFILDKKSIQLSHSNSFSFQNFKFEEFQDLNQDYSGNDLTGVPDKTFFSELHLNTSSGFYTYLNYRFTGQIPITDDNSVYSDAFQVVNLKSGYVNRIGDHFKFELSVGINNIFNEKYASMLQINAMGFGSNSPRYYYPGLPRNYYTSFKLQYRF
ncbi:TonB-dependent receptor [Lutimonas zeaxanthinifaciens]|uniref:TonB-dependent receptor n=1 Tax=Lutimonas zeaxanthinifaciens TaxID=3060215 RepID=UPI00265D1118|nr:TonB-dependent receptor [Lutimonas sp. YSD2104]WKK65826.1 TonB-dependent receptor [Lutimonas sp. YSD2104]